MIYLVQHGEAQAKEENPDRPLTERGEDRARALGDFLARAGIRVDAIHDSGKLLQLFRANRDTGLLPLIFFTVALLL